MRTIACGLLLLIALGWAGALDLSRWSSVADIRLDRVPEKGIVAVDLPAEALDKASPDLSDLRVVQGKDRETAYVTSVPGTPEQIVPLPVRLYNRTFVPGVSSRVTVDTGSGAMKNRVAIDTFGTNFRRAVRIEGSDDGRSWQTIRADGMVFRVWEDGQVLYDKQDVTFSDNNQRYLRVTVFNGSDDPGRIEIRGVKLFRRVAGTEKLATVPVRTFSSTVNGNKTVVSADLGYRNLPLQRVTLQVSDQLFFRQVMVQGRNAETGKGRIPGEPEIVNVSISWTPLGSGAIYRYPGEASLTIDVDGTDSRYLQIKIENEDNQPLRVTGLTVQRNARLLEFKPEAGGPYRLYLGNPAATVPSYDLGHYIGQLRTEGVTRATLGPVLPNPAYAIRPPAQPWSERYQIILWAVLLGVFLVLLLLIRRQLRAARALEASEGQRTAGE